MAFFCKKTTWVLIALLVYPVIASAELPKAEDRPFWTQKTCYREEDTVFGVGLSMGNRSLEHARKESFKAALWEISNYAQINDTTLLLVETQMTYEEQTPEGNYSVWRLVKIPFPMIERTRELITRNKPSTQHTVHQIKKLENEDREDLADELRRALLQGDEEPQVSYGRSQVDKTLPSGSVSGLKPTYQSGDIITLTILAMDNTQLKTVLFSINNSSIRKSWRVNGKNATNKLSFPASHFMPGKQVYSLKITDAAGNVALKSGVFRVDDFHDELYDILSRDID